MMYYKSKYAYNMYKKNSDMYHLKTDLIYNLEY